MTRRATTATLPITTDAVAHVQLKAGTRAQSRVPAAVQRPAKYAVTASSLETKPVMTAALHRGMGALTLALWSAALYATVQNRKSVIQNSETGSVLVTRPVTTRTRPTTMAAAAPAPRRPDKTAPVWPANRLAALRSVEMA